MPDAKGFVKKQPFPPRRQEGSNSIYQT